MDIAIIGYGKMGKTIAQLAKEKGHDIVLIIDDDNLHELTKENLKKADVAIEFTQPEAAFQNIKMAMESGIPIVSGTTGWLDRMQEAIEICLNNKGAFFYASNYSVGVNIFFAINQMLAQLMNNHPQYNVCIEEIHHTEKMDAPSGTAITLAQGILKNLARKNTWVNNGESNPQELFISSKRIENVPGTHAILYESLIDSIEIKHVAHSRMGFANGALMAAEWIIGRRGFFGMKDLLGF